jgi:hypothetical protein
VGHPGADFGPQIIDRSFFNNIEDEREAHENTFLVLLGVHAGQYPERIEARKVARTRAEHDDIIRDRDKLNIPGSMAVIVPAWEIMNLLNIPTFEAGRRKRDELSQHERDEQGQAEPL